MDDDQLLALVADSLHADRPPADAVEAAYAAYGWRTLEADLAQLIDDSAAEVVGFALDAPRITRVVAFQTEHGAIEVAIGDGIIEVTASPPPHSVVVRQPEVAVELPLDGTGRATGPGVTGSIRVELTWPDGSARTPWFTV